MNNHKNSFFDQIIEQAKNAFDRSIKQLVNLINNKTVNLAGTSTTLVSMVKLEEFQNLINHLKIEKQNGNNSPKTTQQIEEFLNYYNENCLAFQLDAKDDAFQTRVKYFTDQFILVSRAYDTYHSMRVWIEVIDRTSLTRKKQWTIAWISSDLEYI